MRNTLFPSRTGLMGQWIFSGLHTCTLMAGHMWFHHWRLSGTCAFFFLSEKKHSFFFFFLSLSPPLRLNVHTIFQVFKNRNCHVAMAPCATLEQLFLLFDAIWVHDSV